MARQSKPETYADSWIKHLGTEHDSAVDEPSIGGRLTTETLRVYKSVAQYWTSPKARRAPVRTRKSILQSYSLLVLWADGHGIADGDLDAVMSSSIILRRSIIELLLSICRTLLTKLLTLYCPEGLDLDRLRNLSQEARLSLVRDKESIDSDSESDSDSDNDNTVSSALYRQDLTEIARDLQTDTQCLMDLEPLIKAAVPDHHAANATRPNSDTALKLSGSPYHDWEPYLVFSDRISRRFPQASAELVTRLGKANLERFLRTKSEREANCLAHERAQMRLEEDKPGGTAQSEMGSKFHDSGIGTSIATPSSYAETVMSYGQRGSGEGTTLKIPPLPDGAKSGQAFECIVCGKLQIITNNSSWKRHLFLDLHPWICIDQACSPDTATFTNRDDWIRHLASDHNFAPEWKSLKCLLCGETVASGKPSILKHLGNHLEEISLGSLPALPEAEAASDVSEETVSHSSLHDYPRNPSRAYCPQCNSYPEGFRGEHELRRHLEANHKSTTVKKWICRDPKDVGIPHTETPTKPLKDCKQCAGAKQYGAYYNAAAHLRRTHFKYKPVRGEKSGNTSKHRPRSGGDWPPMAELKLWMTEVEVQVNEDEEEWAPAQEPYPDSFRLDLTAFAGFSTSGVSSSISQDYPMYASSRMTAEASKNVERGFPPPLPKSGRAVEGHEEVGSETKISVADIP